MAASSPVDGVRELAAVAAQAAGLVLEGVTITPAGRRRVLRVVVDLPEDALGGVPMEAVAVASQALSTALDDSPLMGGAPYVLEVTSPGADRPLTERRHWMRARGRRVRATVDGAHEVTGRLDSADDDGVVIDGRAIDWAQLRTGRIELEFNRPGDGGADGGPASEDLAGDHAQEFDDEDGSDDEEGEV